MRRRGRKRRGRKRRGSRRRKRRGPADEEGWVKQGGCGRER